MVARFGSLDEDADLDRFDRVVTSKWTKCIPSPGTNRDFFNVAVGWDRNSNVTYQDDSVHDAFGAAYTNDDLNRLIVSEEGTGSGGTISVTKRKQEWTLTQTGNWTLDKLDLNGDADWSDPDEWQDGRTHNDVNELTGRDLDNNSGTSGNNYSLAYDAAGNLTDDGTDYEYEWDAFYRLRKVKRTDNQALVAEYRYNGLGYRIAEHADTDTDGDVDGSDKWFYCAYDNRWRLVATFRESDTSPKEEFVHQHAGMRGSGSYIDLVAFRDKDANTAWTTASDATLEERLYYCQNWRADVVAIVQCTNPATGAAKQIEQARYSAYGVPFGLPAGDADSDGDCDAADGTIVTGWSGVSYDVRGDIDLDGDVDSGDVTAVSGLSGASLGREVLSGVGNRKGYAGYEGDDAIEAVWHVRRRVLIGGLGRWSNRDPLAFVDGLCLYAYGKGAAHARSDALGLASQDAQFGGGGGFSGAGASGSWGEKKPSVPGCSLKSCEWVPDGEVSSDISGVTVSWRLEGNVTEVSDTKAGEARDCQEAHHCSPQFHINLQPRYKNPDGTWSPVNCPSQDPWQVILYDYWHGQGTGTQGECGCGKDQSDPNPKWSGPGTEDGTKDGSSFIGLDVVGGQVDCKTGPNQSTATYSALAAQGATVVSGSVKCRCDCLPY